MAALGAKAHKLLQRVDNLSARDALDALRKLADESLSA